MVSKSTSILLAVAVVAVSAVAIIGLGYAYTASTDNTDNTSGATYITLSQGAQASDYTGAFNGTVKFNTVSNAPGSVKYTFDSTQITPIGGYTTVSALSLGTHTITVTPTNTNNASYNFSVTDNSASSDVDAIKMNGTFYIKITAGGVSSIRAYTPGAVNYYDTADSHTAATEEPATKLIESTVTTIEVELFVATLDAPVSPADIVKPLEGVTFTFTAYAPTA